jgi:hypothetical protein
MLIEIYMAESTIPEQRNWQRIKERQSAEEQIAMAKLYLYR